MLLREPPGQTGADQRANRDKYQRVGKLSVQFEEKKRIRWRLKQDINIGKQASKTPKKGCHLDLVLIAE